MDTNQSQPGVTSGASTPEPAVPANKDERMWAMLCHLAAFSGWVIPIPFAGIIGPLIIWSLKKDQFPLVADQGKESMNFQITVAMAFIVGLLLLFVCVGVFVLSALGIFDLVFVIIAAIKAKKGTRYRYPLCVRFIK